MGIRHLRGPLFGLVTPAIICDVVTLPHGFEPWQVMLMSFLLYSGLVQLAVLRLMVVCAPLGGYLLVI